MKLLVLLVFAVLGFSAGAVTIAPPSLPISDVGISAAEHHVDKVTGARCMACKFVVDKLEKMIDTGATEQQIIAAVKQVCNHLPTLLKPQCDAFVSQYGPQVIELLLQKLSPQIVCVAIHLCASHGQQLQSFPEGELTAVSLSLDPIANVEISAAEHHVDKVTGAKCTACKFVVDKLVEMIGTGATKQQIIAAVKQVCSHLPTLLKPQCKAFVSQYGPQVIELLLQKLTPQAVCAALHLCRHTDEQQLQGYPEGEVTSALLNSPSGTFEIFTAEHHDDKVTGPECKECTTIVNLLEQSIGRSSTTQQQIVNGLRRICNLLPSVFDKRECNNFLGDHGLAMIKPLLKKLPPQAVCSALGLCVFDSPHVAQLGQLEMSVKDDGMCQVCEKVMGYVNTAMQNPSTEKNIERVLDVMCLQFALIYKPLCTTIVNTFTPFIIKMLAKYDDPTKVCTSLHLCSSKSSSSIGSQQSAHPLEFQPMAMLQPATLHHLGTEKCSYGPSYWCATVANAKECGVLEHCVMHYNLKVEA